MLTTMDTPNCSSSTATTFVQPSSCSSPDLPTSSDQVREAATSPKQQETYCAKLPSSRSKHNSRHMPYQYPDSAARSPGSCSSDGGDSIQSDADPQDDHLRQHSKVKRVQANSRERKRMHTVNSAFDQLRELVPTYPSNRKLSKIDTLRLACTYIQDLVSLLHNTQGIQGDDVLYHQPPFPDSFNGYPVSVKQEISDFQQFGIHDQFRMQQACLRFPNDCPEPYTSSASESDSTHSPPQQFMPCPPPPPPSSTAALGSRPPPLTRVSSEGTTSIHTRMAEASISGPVSSVPIPAPSTTSMYQRQVNITSPLAMHSVQHSSPILQNGLGHHTTPPVWQRATSMPTGYALYGQ